MLKISLHNLEARKEPKVFLAAKTILEKRLGQESADWHFLKLATENPASSFLSLLPHISQYSNGLVIGIGGSDLGTRAIYSALTLQKPPQRPLYFAGDSLIPQELLKDLKKFNEKDTLPIIVSKSGTTLETLTAFNFLWQRYPLKKAVVITDKESPLWQLALKKGFFTLQFPKNVGGRYSVLSTSALFAIAFAGYKIEAILNGAQKALSHLREALKEEASLWQEPACLLAVSHFLALNQHRQNIAVLALYGNALEPLGNWWRQLWAESLGKNGRGQTPIVAVMPRDQHSQLQLYLDGPADKIYTFLRVNHYQDETLNELQPLPSPLKRKSLTGILDALFLGTTGALFKKGRPLLILETEELNQEFLGEFFLSYEIACALLGELLKINPFSQEAVEAGKKISRSLLFK